MDLSLEKLKEAVSIREQIDTLQQRLSSIFGSSGESSSRASTSSMAESGSTSGGGRGRGRGGRRTMSAATRAKLAEAARRRWASGGNIGNTAAKSGGAKGGGAKNSAKRGGGGKGRGRLSAAGRKAISDAMKARWAARRAGRKS
jgi:hypothetical protein